MAKNYAHVTTIFTIHLIKEFTWMYLLYIPK